MKKLLLSAFLLINGLSSAFGTELPDQESYETLSHKMVAINEEDIERRAAELINIAETNGLSAEDLAEAKKFIMAATETPLWRFYLMNGGLNGPLTEYMALYHDHFKTSGKDLFDKPILEMDRWYLEECPFILAYQQNHRNCKRLIQTYIDEQHQMPSVKLASIACGTLYEFMSFKIDREKTIDLYGFDIDQESLDAAQANAIRYKKVVKTYQQDAWKPLPEGPFHVITCNGFTIYEPSDDRLVELFNNFYKHLEAGGMMIASFMLPKQFWDMSDTTLSTLQNMSLMQHIPSKWTGAFRDQSRMKSIAMKAGFEESKIRFEEEPRKIHPSIVAVK